MINDELDFRSWSRDRQKAYLFRVYKKYPDLMHDWENEVESSVEGTSESINGVQSLLELCKETNNVFHWLASRAMYGGGELLDQNNQQHVFDAISTIESNYLNATRETVPPHFQNFRTEAISSIRVMKGFAARVREFMYTGDSEVLANPEEIGDLSLKHFMLASVELSETTTAADGPELDQITDSVNEEWIEIQNRITAENKLLDQMMLLEFISSDAVKKLFSILNSYGVDVRFNRELMYELTSSAGAIQYSCQFARTVDRTPRLDPFYNEMMRVFQCREEISLRWREFALSSQFSVLSPFADLRRLAEWHLDRAMNCIYTLYDIKNPNENDQDHSY